ncbi:MAG: lysylphosphatidylglycerol synthase transmembrane domain-containing protein [Candidatus Binatia bacterium]
MRPALRLALLAIGLVVLVLLCRTLGLGELRRALAAASPAKLGVFLLLTTAVFLTHAVRWRVVLRTMNAPPVPLPVLLSFRAAEQAVSTLIPSGHLSSEPLRAFLLRRRGLDWTTSISSVAMDRVLELTSMSVAGPIYVAVFFFGSAPGSQAAPWAMALMLSCSAALAAFYYFAYRGGTLISVFARFGVFASMRASLESIDRNLAGFIRTRRFPGALALSFLAELLVLAELWTLSRAFDLPITLPTLVGVMLGMGIAQIVPMPAAVGTLEAIQIGVLTLAGGDAPLGLAVGLIIRLRETLWIVVGLAGLYLEGLSWGVIESRATG